MKNSVDPAIYTKDYYLNACLGSEEFNQSGGRDTHERTKKILSLANIKPGLRILDVGCGRGDVVFYAARAGAEAYGIDYSKDGIALAKQATKRQPKSCKNKVHFSIMDAKKLEFPDNFFDVIISIDVFEHLYKDELEIAMKGISRVLKKDGTLLVHTEPNVIYLNFTHPFYLFPVSEFLIKINKVIFGKNYPGLPKDPRNDLHKKQHVNEPTYFYLNSLFHRHHFTGKLFSYVSSLKPRLSWKDQVYNIIVFWYPLCFIPPFLYLFAYDYVAIMQNKK